MAEPDRDLVLKQQTQCLKDYLQPCLHLGLAMGNILRVVPLPEPVQSFGILVETILRELEPVQVWLDAPPAEDIRELAGAFGFARQGVSEGEKTLRALIRRGEKMQDPLPSAALQNMDGAKSLLTKVKVELDVLIAVLTPPAD